MIVPIPLLTGTLLIALAGLHAVEPPILELGPDGHLPLNDNGCEQVLELDREGNVLGRYGGSGTAPRQAGLMHWAAPAPDGAIFVTGVFNRRVQRLVPSESLDDGHVLGSEMAREYHGDSRALPTIGVHNHVDVAEIVESRPCPTPSIPLLAGRSPAGTIRRSSPVSQRNLWPARNVRLPRCIETELERGRAE